MTPSQQPSSQQPPSQQPSSQQPPTEQPPTEQPPTTALISGATRGIGLATARALLAAGWTVWLGARDEQRGQAAGAALADLHLPGEHRVVALDVTSDDSVAAAAARIEQTGLDVLINNAGVAGDLPAPADTLPADFLPVYGVNVLGPVRLTHALLPVLLTSARPRVVNVSSGVGSFANASDPERARYLPVELVYSSSKAALNMITVQSARAFPAVTFTAVDPGYTATDLNGHTGFQTVEEGAAPVVAAAMAGPGGASGRFLSGSGPLGW